MNTASLPQILNALSRAMLFEQRQAAVSAGLLPVQLAILGYLRDANRYSNMPQCLAEYLGLTKGTVSQSLKILEEKGWVLRQPDINDRRIVRLAISETGRSTLEQSDDDAWRIAANQLPASEQESLRRLLTQLLASWQHEREGKTFGICRTCRHFRQGDQSHLCGLTGEGLSESDSARICREHSLS
ncbi:MAG: MarR family transcriptional regulator [Dechloromonas sp.]|nr:MarR family transcriptional regulator [Dechloromonas sp.]